jgi:hypothetical protein
LIFGIWHLYFSPAFRPEACLQEPGKDKAAPPTDELQRQCEGIHRFIELIKVCFFIQFSQKLAIGAALIKKKFFLNQNFV